MYRPEDRSLAFALSLYLLLLSVSVLAILCVAQTGANVALALRTVTLVDALIAILWTWGCFRRVKPALTRAGHWLAYPIASALGLATGGIALVMVKALVAASGGEELAFSDSLQKAGYGWPSLILFLCIIPAIFEELAFRGVILGLLDGLLRTRDAVIVSAVMFMVLHLAALSFPHLLMMGLILGYVRIRTGSVYPCMVLHFTHNLLALLLEVGGV